MRCVNICQVARGRAEGLEEVVVLSERSLQTMRGLRGFRAGPRCLLQPLKLRLTQEETDSKR